MKRLLPSSLIGQVALVIALALLVAQALNFSLVSQERARASQAQFEGPALARFIGVANHSAFLEGRQGARLLSDLRWINHWVSESSIVQADRSDPRLSSRLKENAAAIRLPAREVRAELSQDPPIRLTRPAAMKRYPDEETTGSLQLSVQLSDGRWFNASIARPPSDSWLSVRLLAPALLLYLLLLGGAVLIAARLTRPLRELTEAADRYCGTGEPVQIRPRGPQDLQRAILAFNAMSGRVKQMLEDKDRMLGAIGHDLRTPLACLRVRIESMSPEDQRERAVDKIEEMSDILQDTLELARSQAPGEPTRIVDLAALADTVVEEFRALGHDVESLEAAGRVTAPVKSTLLRRALRNLVENGVKYGGKVEVAARMTDAGAILEVADAGPGIPESQLENVLEPFVRLERSRNRGTGGSGLGLALARSAAHAHQGTLELSNRPEGGLLARIILPRLATSFK